MFMALIKCPECEKEISDQAEICVGCGFPINKILSDNPTPVPVKKTIVNPETDFVAKPEPPPKIIKKQSSDCFGAVKEFFHRNKRKIRKALIIILIIALIVVLTVFPPILSNLDFAKDSAKEEVLATWQEVDKDIKLEKIKYTKTRFEIADKDQVEDIVDEIAYPPIKHTDVNGVTYDSIYDYWDSIDYDPYDDIWRIYTIEGKYTVRDTFNTYRGNFKVVFVVGLAERCWHRYSTEIEVPKQFREYMP